MVISVAILNNTKGNIAKLLIFKIVVRLYYYIQQSSKFPSSFSYYIQQPEEYEMKSIFISQEFIINA